MEENKRIRKRFPYEYSVMSFECGNAIRKRKPCERPLHITVNDISYSGLGIKVNHKLMSGDRVYINLTDGYESENYELEIMWCSFSVGAFKAGCAFKDLTEPKIRLVDRIIKGIHGLK